MGFNPRLAPHTFNHDFDPLGLSASATNDHLLFKFPFAGQILRAYWSTLDSITDDTTTGISLLSLWKFTTDDAVADFVTGLVSAQMTDAIIKANATPRIEKTCYAMTNSSTASRLKYNAGDRVMLRSTWRHNSGASRVLHIVVEYMHGHDSS